MNDYEKAKGQIESSIHVGIAAEEDWDGPSVKPDDLTDKQIAWLAAWLAGEGFSRA